MVRRGAVSVIGSHRCWTLIAAGMLMSLGCTAETPSDDGQTEINGMTTRPFQGVPSILTLSCSGRVLPPDTKLMALDLFTVLPTPIHHPYHPPPSPEDEDEYNNNNNNNNKIIASMDLLDGECYTSDSFSSCDIVDRDSRRSTVSTLVIGIGTDEVRRYGCEVSSRRSGERTSVFSWYLDVRRNRTTTTVAPTTTTSTTTTVRPQPPSESPVASGVKSNVQEFQLPISVVIIGLVLLLFFAILCAILVILQCRGKRRRRSRAANRESLLSAKNEPMGEGGYRTPRNVPSYPPGHMPPETPGGNFAMRYQKSIPDTGYVSGSSVYYSEPYGTLDEEMKERLRPNPRMCHIPYDIKGGPLDTTHPQEHSA